MMLTLRSDLRAGDAHACFAIVRACGNFTPAEITFVPEILETLARDGERSGYRLLIAESPTIVGFAIYGPIEATEGSHDLYWIATDPAFQGQGVGRALLTRAVADIAREGGQRLFIETETGAAYEAAHQLYESAGFPRIATLPDFFGPGRAKAIYGGPISKA